MEQIYPYILSIASGLIILLLGIVGFWLTRYVRTTDTLSNLVNKLNIILTKLVVEQDSFQSSCTEHKASTTKRLDNHKAKLEDHGERITILETKK